MVVCRTAIMTYGKKEVVVKFLKLGERGAMVCHNCGTDFVLQLSAITDAQPLHEVFGAGRLVRNCPFCDLATERPEAIRPAVLATAGPDQVVYNAESGE